MNERALLLGASGSRVGILSLPPASHGAVAPDRPAVIVLNAGHVHRVGPQRLHVMLLRQLAQRGYTGLRFDFSGIGDSLVRSDNLPFELGAVQEVGEAMDALTAQTGITRFCLVGLSSGALMAMASALEDSRVAGVVTINPHGFASTEEWTEHVETLSLGRIYAGNLLQLDSWRKLFTGRTDYKRLARSMLYRAGLGRRSAVAGAGVSEVVERLRPRLLSYFALQRHTLMLFSAKDRSLENLDEILGSGWPARVGAHVAVRTLADANHTLASPLHLAQAVQAIGDWAEACWPATAVAGGAAGHAPGLPLDAAKDSADAPDASPGGTRCGAPTLAA